VSAVGTNTLRQVRDRGAFLRKAEAALGHPIEIIAGREEARLVYVGVAHGLAAGDDRRLVVDIGGGSTELILGKQMSPYERESLFMGCVSFGRRFFPDGQIDEARMNRAITAGRLELRPVRKLFETGNWDQAVGSSGTVKAIQKVLQAAGWSEAGINRSGLKRLRKELVRAGHIDKVSLEGLADERRPVFAGGVAVLSAVFKSLNIERMSVSELALREGLLYELVGLIQHQDIRDHTVTALVQRFGLDEQQGLRVGITALSLLDDVAGSWGLDRPEHAELLGWASRLHEIGLIVSHGSFHKHGAYILANSDLPGFSRQQQTTLAALVRGHRRKFPAPVFDELGDADTSRRLCVLLRLAVLLHRGRASGDKRSMRALAENDRIQVRFPDDWLEDHPLTRAELASEAELLASAGFVLEYA
jgi:exopolyphosphatase/guanosine-5'-triphosphate,3'-diphosphate pyrophosphatase